MNCSNFCSILCYLLLLLLMLLLLLLFKQKFYVYVQSKYKIYNKYTYIYINNLGSVRFFYVLERSLYLFDQKYSKISKIVKYYNLK